VTRAFWILITWFYCFLVKSGNTVNVPQNIEWYYPRQDLARDYLVEFQRRGARALTVFAERGAGKTAFLQRDLAVVAAKNGRLPVYVDAWAVRGDPAIGIADQLKAVVQALEHKDPRRREVTGFNVSVLGVGGGVTAAHRAEPGEPTNQMSRLNFWGDRLASLSGEKKVMLMIDEVQALATHRDGVEVASALRATFQRNYERFEPVFTGSQRDRLLQMFKTSRAPLFQFGDTLDFPQLDHRFTAFVAEKLRAESKVKVDLDQLQVAFETLGRKPGTLIAVARHMLRVKDYNIPAAAAAVLSQERDEHEREWSLSTLGPLDQIVFALAAHERSLFSKDALLAYAQHLDVEAVSTKAAQNAIARLRDKELLFSTERGVYRVNNPAIAQQMRESTPHLAKETTLLYPKDGSDRDSGSLIPRERLTARRASPAGKSKRAAAATRKRKAT
jgi:hypothetical protein